MNKRMVFLLFFCFFCLGWAAVTNAQSLKENESNSTDTATMSITRLVIGTGVNLKEPLGISDTFPSTTPKVICFLDAADIVADTTVRFVWFFNSQEVLTTELPLRKGPRWRTRADKRLYGQKGDWKVEIRDNAGQVLKEIQFKVE